MSKSESSATRLSALLLNLERTLRRSYHVSQITPARVSALHTISQISNCTIGQLAQAEQVTAPTITGIVDALEATGLITRKADGKDRRITRLTLTTNGHQTLDNWYSWRAERLSEMLKSSGFSDDEIGQLNDYLDKIRRPGRNAPGTGHVAQVD